MTTAPIEDEDTDSGEVTDFAPVHLVCKVCFPGMKKGSRAISFCGEVKVFDQDPQEGMPDNACVVCIDLMPAHMNDRHGIMK